MVNKINKSKTFHPLQSQVELEFLEALLSPDDATYPWNPADEESETYFLQLEQQFLMQDVLDSELTPRSEAFYSQLDQLWSNYKQSDCNTPATPVTTLQETLHNSFGSSIPTNWLNAIALKATEVFNTQQSMAEQLIQCVQAVLPTWGSEDLLVLARPFAYAMRSSESQTLESVLNNVDNREWTALSQIEQAKASLAIAYYAFSQLNNSQQQP
ncbi:MAG: hypothetical protein DSM106950_08175 [Stigonema ocellatum SAG 48.90 = DSM 106950]|nr:hypothetical protein [Stigonema ocellatum SAG 48.90 = DSM 106950]